MKNNFLNAVTLPALIAVFLAQIANAADLPKPAAIAPPTQWTWTGLYLGAQVGAATGVADFTDPFGSSIFGDKVTTPGFLAGGRVGYNWQVPNTAWVLGAEADANALISDGTNTCLAFSGGFISPTCHVRPDIFGTLTARVGYAFGPNGRTLLYAKGGAAWRHENVDLETNDAPIYLGRNLLPNTAIHSNFTTWGWTAGTGVEHALAPAWTLSLEYDYLNFGNSHVATPESLLQAIGGLNLYRAFPPNSTSFSQNLHEVKLGLNYKFGEDLWATWTDNAKDAPSFLTLAAGQGWEFDFGSRVWFSSGKYQWNIGAQASTHALSDISRLTYAGLTGYTGEYFQRIDTPWNVFLKGNAGLGGLTAGHLNDEDWGLDSFRVPYSNTVSTADIGELGYVTIDLGWNTLRNTAAKLGPFVGYNYFTERWDARGCAQIANRYSDCVPSSPTSMVGITENSTWNSLRVGINGETIIFDRLKLGADMAFLPYVSMSGRDNHLARTIQPTFFDQQGHGQGVQLETILSYYLTNDWTVGVGGRYWALWTKSATDTCTGCGGAGVVSHSSPAKFDTERYGVFLQSTYQFNIL